MATLTTLATFDGTNGANPSDSLLMDAAGNLVGTTANDGANGRGTVFEIAKTATGYASTPTTLVNFDYNGTGGNGDGAEPRSGLIADAAGDLFGTTFSGGTDGSGTIYEIAKTANGYATKATILVSLDGTDGSDPDYGNLTFDAAGDLFDTTTAGGTTANGGFGFQGAVFEVAKTASGYATTATALVSFDGTDGEYPQGGLIADTAGNLFGTTQQAGPSDDGTVFEIAKTATGYASTPTTLATFNGTDGSYPEASLIADANGDLFGTTTGSNVTDGTVFEITRTASGYASTPTVLVTFNGADGDLPLGGLVANAAGDLFGTTVIGGAYGDGTVFEIAKTATGYASTPTTLFSFNGADGGAPEASLIFDASGNLYGTTTDGGANQDGTVFELSGIGATSPTPSWLPPLGPPDNFTVSDQSTTGAYAGQSWQSKGTAYTGPVTGLSSEFIAVTSDNINVTAKIPNVFISVDGGGGEDAIAVNQANGNNVLNGSTGSSFLDGGTGGDTFFVDDRNPPAGSSIWSTVVGFHAGDNATVWGVTPSDFTLSWADGQGATGYTGLTLHAAASGAPTASLTLTGLTSADLSNGALSISYGTTPNLLNLPGSNYMLIHYN